MSTHIAVCLHRGGAKHPKQRSWHLHNKNTQVANPRRKFYLPRGRIATTKAAGFLFRVRDDDDSANAPEASGDFDGLIMSDKVHWDAQLEAIQSMEVSGKAISILGMDSPDDYMPPTWVEILQLRDAFISSGARSVDYIHYEEDSFKIDW